MRNFYMLCFSFVCFSAVAQEMIVPSSFDENKMIVKKMDSNGNFVPVDENTLPVLNDNGVVETQSQEKTLPKRKKRLKKVETAYDFPKTTFGTGTDTMELPSTFATETMADELQEVQREHTTFQECAPNDKNCQEYDVDEKGQVIFK